MKPEQSHPNSQLFNPDRLVFLIDGVFAITLTLLVLDLRLSDDISESLPAALVSLLPRLLIYLFAFITIANQWTIHHRTFRFVRHTDSRLVTLSLVNLLFITLIPASSAIVGSYPTKRLAAACFAINALLMCLSAWAIWGYIAAQSRLLAEGTDIRILGGIARVWLYMAAGFGFAMLLGLVSVYIEYASWILWGPMVSAWWYRERMKYV